MKNKTPFEKHLDEYRKGTLVTPTVSGSDSNIDYFGYQLSVHKYNLSLMTKGLNSKGIKLKHIKLYYGLKGRSAKDCLPQFLEIMKSYTEDIKNSRIYFAVIDKMKSKGEATSVGYCKNDMEYQKFEKSLQGTAEELLLIPRETYEKAKELNKPKLKKV